jgi:signal transduction histidine kinase
VLKSLQGRLVLSYLVVILVCLVFVGLAALVLLRGYQTNLIYTRLRDRDLLAARLAGEFLRRGATPESTVERLAQQMNRGDAPRVQVYLLDRAGRVEAGSDDALEGRHIDRLALRSVAMSDWPVRGAQALESGARLLYVAEPIRASGEGEQRAATHVLLLAEALRPARLALGDLLPRLGWAGAIAMIVSVGVAGLMAYSIARPLDRIAQAAEEIAGGNYEQELDISAPREVARLIDSFNSMANQIQATLQSQQDLVANVSHELKTPLTSIQGFSQALVDGTAGDAATRKRAATIIHEEAGRMRRLVDDLLDLARLEAGQVVLAQQRVDLGEVLEACVGRLAPVLEQHAIALERQVAPVLPPILGDPDRLEQVFGNLLDNALKHARAGAEGGRVCVGAEYADNTVVCSISDNGPGIPAEDLPRIFERFYQVDKSRSRHGSGAGLGLAIAREIVQAHGGQISVESVQGLGTRFAVEFPAQRSLPTRS